jgi:hypothetical protein
LLFRNVHARGAVKTIAKNAQHASINVEQGGFTRDVKKGVCLVCILHRRRLWHLQTLSGKDARRVTNLV